MFIHFIIFWRRFQQDRVCCDLFTFTGRGYWGDSGFQGAHCPPIYTELRHPEDTQDAAPARTTGPEKHSPLCMFAEGCIVALGFAFLLVPPEQGTRKGGHKGPRKVATAVSPSKRLAQRKADIRSDFVARQRLSTGIHSRRIRWGKPWEGLAQGRGRLIRRSRFRHGNDRQKGNGKKPTRRKQIPWRK